MSGEDTYRLTGGARAHGFNASHPLAKVVATRERILITIFWFYKLDIPRDRIASIRRHQGMMSKGLLIDSSVVGGPLILWTKRQDEVIRELARLGYPISNMPSQAQSWMG